LNFYWQAILNPKAKERFSDKVALLWDPNLVTRLYYCGSLENPHRLGEILRNGFTQEGKQSVLDH
jgi:hypothetical protein